MLWLLTFLLVVSLVSAVSKPLGGKVNGGAGQVSLFVEVDFINQKEICIINPLVQTGSTGDFATNLANLVLENFPQTSCASFWQAGDKIWFEFKDLKSEIQFIEKGTGLQMLKELVITAPADSSPSSGGGSGSPAQEVPSSPSAESEIAIELKAEQTPAVVKSLLKVAFPTNLNKNLEVKIVLSDFFNDKTLAVQQDRFFLTNQFEKDYSFALENLALGQYKLQAFVYDGPNLIGVSKVFKFTIGALEEKAEEVIEVPAGMAQEALARQWPFVLLILALAALVIIWLLHKKH